ncbi:hypothetical protein MG290_01630 [Flavobacterium sp. CBA20B-1]|uniref:hypothetical protein n=1 Tax=unclassified Flavobacterium TaxID=196869 RepID=UPI0022244723|nr:MULTISPECIES: hypothetical protein [unclassified Flavobacterium]WCM42396.1 hypothetical protein MG290_01630 [Flavobacterium sp. CBA20B-1]
MNKRQKIAGRLKALFPKANLSTKRIDVITAKLESKVSDDADDTAIDEIVNQANEFMDFEAIAKEDDRVRTLEANQKKGDEGGNPPKDDPTPEPPKDDTPEWAKALLSKVDALEKGKITESKANTVADLFSKSEILKGLPENQKQSWLKRVNLESEDLAAEVASLETEYTELRQSFADSADLAGGTFNKTEGKTAVADADLDAVMGRL